MTGLRWVTLAAFALGTGTSAMAQPATVPLAAHRAVYDLKLADKSGNSAVEAVRARIVYDFAGSACEGYTMNFRQVTEIEAGDGSTVSDLRAATFEDDAGTLFRFTSQSFLNNTPDVVVDGKAERRAGEPFAAVLTAPKEATVPLPDDVMFPTAQIKAIIAAARAGSPILEARVFDGSDEGDTVYDTLAVIGRAIAPEAPRAGVAASKRELDGLDRWPVTISYFDPAVTIQGEQTPVYSVAFELYANGVTDAMTLDYGDFKLSGGITTIDFTPTKPCD